MDMVEEVRMLAMGRLRSVYTNYTLDKLGKDKEMFHIRDDIVRRTRGTHNDLEAAKRLVRLSISCQVNLPDPGHVHHSPGQCPCSHEAGPQHCAGEGWEGGLGHGEPAQLPQQCLPELHLHAIV